MAEVERGWAASLHRLWGAVATITSREQLAEIVLPPLRTLPGVVAVWGLRHGPRGETFLAYRWSGLTLDQAAAVPFAIGADGPAQVFPAPESLRARGVEQVVAAGFAVPGEAPGTFLVLAGPGTDVPLVAECLVQVVDATRQAVRLLASRRAEEDQQVRDALLAEASLQMDAVLDMTQTMQRVARMAVPAIAEGCLVYVCDEDKPVLRSAVHVDMRRLEAFRSDPGAEQLLGELAQAGVAGHSRRVRADGTALTGTRTVDAQALRARGRVVGVLIFLFDRADDLVPPPSFLRDLAYRAALAIDNGELYEQRRRDVVALQGHLLPKRLPTAEGLDVAASYRVGDQVLEVGGDFYDVVTRRDGVVAALIGDVCGRGVAAAALTGMARHTLGTLLHEGVSPARALGRLNTGLLRDGSWRFVTAGVALLRPAAGSLGVQWSSCGHPAPIVLRADGTVEAGRGGGVPLGIVAKPSVGRSRLRLAPGDTLLMFTDGLAESRNAAGTMFEEAGLRETIHGLRHLAPQDLVHELGRAAAEFGVTGSDDIAVLAIRAKEQDR